MQGIDHLEIRYRRADTVGAWTTFTLPKGMATMQIPNVQRGLTYQVEARAVGTNGEPSIWVQQTHTVADAFRAPIAPTSLSALSVADGVHLAWTITGIQWTDVEYDVERTNDLSGAPDPSGWVNITNVKALTYTDGITDGIVRWYRVRAVDFQQNVSAYSNDVSSQNKSVQNGADVTGDQPIVYTGLSSNLVPNGTFILGNVDGWAGLDNGGYLSGGISVTPGGDGAVSPTFNVTPGQKYRFSFTGMVNSAGTQIVYFRLAYQATYLPNIFPVSYVDLMANGVIASSLTTYTYDWTCPGGVFYASLLMYNVGTASLLVTNVSAQDYVAAAEWGADVTGSNTANNTNNVGDLTVNGSGGLTGSSGIVFDQYGNIVLKNAGTSPGTVTMLGSTFGSLVGMGSGDPGMAYTLKGNPVLVGVSLSFQATSSGGVVTSTGFVPTNATTSTGTSPPTVSIVISGDGHGATASVSWTGSGGPTVTFTPTVSLYGGAGYTYANAIVTVSVPSGTTYGGPGSGTYSCSVTVPVPEVGVSLSAQVLVDGTVLINPSQGCTDANGRAKFNDLQLFNIPAGAHAFSVQAKHDGATSATFLGGTLTIVELG